MERFQDIGQQMINFLTDSYDQKVRSLLGSDGARFIVCGTSGSGKTRAIEFANSRLPSSEQIAESGDLLFEKDALKAAEVFNKWCYPGYKHIGFSIVNRFLAHELEAQAIKVFWVNAGSSDDAWR